MSKQLEVNHQSLLDAYYDYYTAKLASREHFENINKIGKSLSRPFKIKKDSSY